MLHSMSGSAEVCILWLAQAIALTPEDSPSAQHILRLVLVDFPDVVNYTTTRAAVAKANSTGTPAEFGRSAAAMCHQHKSYQHAQQ